MLRFTASKLLNRSLALLKGAFLYITGFGGSVYSQTFKIRLDVYKRQVLKRFCFLLSNLNLWNKHKIHFSDMLSCDSFKEIFIYMQLF